MTEQEKLPGRTISGSNTSIREMWAALQPLTAARIGLPRAGSSLATSALLDFRLAQAKARDAVASSLDTEVLQAAIAALGESALVCQSAAADHATYLMRPDLGRQLDAASLAALEGRGEQIRQRSLSIVIADGLSAQAAQSHALPLLKALMPLFKKQGFALAPIVLLHHGRVAAGDAIAGALKAECVLVLLGERPGLSSPDSLGAYMTWAPNAATSDADRNCVSNIRQQGLAPALAAEKIAYLLAQMRTQQRSGVALKDLMPALATGGAPQQLDAP